MKSICIISVLVILFCASACDKRPGEDPENYQQKIFFTEIKSISKNKLEVVGIDKEKMSLTFHKDARFYTQDMDEELSWKDFKKGEDVRVVFYYDGSRYVAVQVRKGSHYVINF